jgi:uncharacterized OB-fold protein
VVGYDEDAFTLASTAIERVVASWEPSSEPVEVHLLGAAQSLKPELLAALIARPVHPHSSGADGRALRAALGEAERSVGTGPALVVVAEDWDGSGPVPPAPGAGAVAFLWEGVTSSEVRTSVNDPVPPVADQSALGAAFHYARDHSGRGSATWTGDWDSSAGGVAADPERLRLRVAEPPAAVSEGAYVPHARYLESLGSRWRFEGDRCPQCGLVTFPARGKCRGCANRNGLVPVRLPFDGGTVVSVTEIGRGGQPTEFDRQVESTGPYAVVLVDLADGVRATLQVTDAAPGTLRIGDRVATRIRRLYPMEGEWRYGRKALPLTGPDASP